MAEGWRSECHFFTTFTNFLYLTVAWGLIFLDAAFLGCCLAALICCYRRPGAAQRLGVLAAVCFSLNIADRLVMASILHSLFDVLRQQNSGTVTLDGLRSVLGAPLAQLLSMVASSWVWGLRFAGRRGKVEMVSSGGEVQGLGMGDKAVMWGHRRWVEIFLADVSK